MHLRKHFAYIISLTLVFTILTQIPLATEAHDPTELVPNATVKTLADTNTRSESVTSSKIEGAENRKEVEDSSNITALTTPPAENPDILTRSMPVATVGTITIEGDTTTYNNLQAAIDAATDNAIICISGSIDIAIPKITVNKSITLTASSTGAVLTSSNNNSSIINRNTVIEVNNGASLTIKSGSDNDDNFQLKDIHILVKKGKLALLGGHFISNTITYPEAPAIINITGAESSATFAGGTVENPCDNYGNFNNYHSVKISNGAKVDKISGGKYLGAYHCAILVEDAGSEIGEITGGHFEHSFYARQSEPNVKVHKQGKICTISGGNFYAHRFGALQLESGGRVDTITGGVFEHKLDVKDENGKLWGFNNGSGADPYFSGLVLYGRFGANLETSVGTISGGTFSGFNGVLTVGDLPSQMCKIESITGGTFSGSFNSGLYFTQNSEIGKLAGNIVAKGKACGIWNAGTIKEISNGTFIGQENDGLQNVDFSQLTQITWGKNFKGNIEKITGGSFQGAKSGITNAGHLEEITGGTFAGQNSAISCSNRTKKGTFAKLSGGNFYAEKGQACISLVAELQLEPDLNAEIGQGRFFAPVDKPIFNDEAKVKYPSYQKADGSQAKYFMSTSNDTKKDVASYPSIGFRYLRKGYKLAYIFNLNGDNTQITNDEIQPNSPVTLWQDVQQFNKPTNGATFKNWNTQADGKGTNYQGGSTIASLTSDLSLYAIWNNGNKLDPAIQVSPSTDNSESELIDLTLKAKNKPRVAKTGELSGTNITSIFFLLGIALTYLVKRQK